MGELWKIETGNTECEDDGIQKKCAGSSGLKPKQVLVLVGSQSSEIGSEALDSAYFWA